MKRGQVNVSRYPVSPPERIVYADRVNSDELARARFLWAQQPEIKYVCGPVYCWLLAIVFSISLITSGYLWLAVGSFALTLLGTWWWWIIEKRYACWKRDYFSALDRLIKR